MAKAKTRSKGKAAGGNNNNKKKKKAAKKRSPQKRAAITKKKESQRAVTTALPTDADNDIIPSKEVTGLREGPVRCETCNTDFASRQDFEGHAIQDHPDIPARIAE